MLKLGRRVLFFPYFFFTKDREAHLAPYINQTPIQIARCVLKASTNRSRIFNDRMINSTLSDEGADIVEIWGRNDFLPLFFFTKGRDAF